MKKSTISRLISIIFSVLPLTVFAQEALKSEELNVDDVIVTANRFEHKESETTYASEIHTTKQIEASGAVTLYDYLSQQTSLNVGSNFGSKATPSINVRGFGGENGYQNVVITVDGQRLNNIDQMPQLLGAIPLGNIERIEIIKGSGSVLYGDGATAGTIKIYTKNKTGVSVSASAGNYGQITGNASAGLSQQYFDVSVNLAHDQHDGFSKKAADGEKDNFESTSQNAKLKIKPVDSLSFNFEGTSSRTAVRFVNPMTKAQFNNDPRQNGKPLNAYTRQDIDSDQWSAGFEYDMTKNIKFAAKHFQEDKKSIFPGYVADYQYGTNDIALSFSNDNISAIVGYQNFDGDRKDDFNDFSKDNEAVFVSGEYKIDALTLSSGYRRETVDYRNLPNNDDPIKGDYKLNAWDIGANYRFTPELSVFSNFNKGFQTPDIDRSFVFDLATFKTVFSGFIKPAESRIFNIGLNHTIANNRFKATAFYSKIKNEIYLDPTLGFFGTNTNADKTHKYGLELQDYYKVTDNLSASVIYNYTRAIVDKEIAFDGTEIKNKDLPGAPKHTMVANLNYQFLEHATVNLNHTWRARAYAYNDFANNANQRQGNYQTTNIALNYQYKNLQFFTAINNIFEHENSIQVADDVLYPIDFVRTWRVGMKADF